MTYTHNIYTWHVHTTYKFDIYAWHIHMWKVDKCTADQLIQSMTTRNFTLQKCISEHGWIWNLMKVLSVCSLQTNLKVGILVKHVSMCYVALKLVAGKTSYTHWL